MTAEANRRAGTGPVEPAASSFAFPPPSTADDRGRVVVGGDLGPGTLLAAYRSGLFPMRQGDGALAWWSPDPRGILLPAELHISHSLRRAVARYEVRVDTAFEAVVDACAERPEGEYHWITREIREAYTELHRLGWAHSVETWTPATADSEAQLVGGLYGVAVGGLFGGESMFHRRPDASKVALVGLVKLLRDGSRDATDRLIDVQWLTPHMASVGARAVSRLAYLDLLERAIAAALPPAFHRPDATAR